MPQSLSLGMCFTCSSKKPCLFHSFSIFVYTLLSSLPGLSSLLLDSRFLQVQVQVSRLFGCYVFSKIGAVCSPPSSQISVLFRVATWNWEAGNRWSSLWSMWGRWSCNLDKQPAGEGKSILFRKSWDRYARIKGVKIQQGFRCVLWTWGKFRKFSNLRLLSMFVMANHGGTAEKWKFSHIHVGN